MCTHTPYARPFGSSRCRYLGFEVAAKCQKLPALSVRVICTQTSQTWMVSRYAHGTQSSLCRLRIDRRGEGELGKGAAPQRRYFQRANIGLRFHCFGPTVQARRNEFGMSCSRLLCTCCRQSAMKRKTRCKVSKPYVKPGSRARYGDARLVYFLFFCFGGR